MTTSHLSAMSVERVCDGHLSGFAPPLRQEWSEAKKLQWLLGIVGSESGLWLTLHTRDEGATFGISGHGTSFSAMPFTQAWHALTFISAGAQMLARKLVRDADANRTIEAGEPWLGAVLPKETEVSA
jgi:hypothetical protein